MNNIDSEKDMFELMHGTKSGQKVLQERIDIDEDHDLMFDIDKLQIDNPNTCVFSLTGDCSEKEFMIYGSDKKCFGGKYYKCENYMEMCLRYRG